MDAKDTLKLVLEALRELKKQNISRQTLIDFLRGNESRAIKDKGLDTFEFFGSGDKREEIHYGMVIDQAVEEKFLREEGGIVTSTSKGERFRKSPTSFILKEEGDETGPGEGDDKMLDILVRKALDSKDDDVDEDPIPIVPNPATARSQQLVHLIQAIDRKIPLDDYAEQMQLGFDEVLDMLESLVHQGVKFDISYFINEILDKDCQQELLDYLDEVDGNIERAIEEFYGVYQPEEIRLMRYMLR